MSGISGSAVSRLADAFLPVAAGTAIAVGDNGVSWPRAAALLALWGLVSLRNSGAVVRGAAAAGVVLLSAYWEGGPLPALGWFVALAIGVHVFARNAATSNAGRVALVLPFLGSAVFGAFGTPLLLVTLLPLPLVLDPVRQLSGRPITASPEQVARDLRWCAIGYGALLVFAAALS